MKTVASDLDVEIRNGVGAPGSARRAVGRLADRLPRARLEGLQLLVSELVTNSVRHAGMGPDGRIRVRVRLDRDSIRLEVTDGGPGFVPPSCPESPRPQHFAVPSRSNAHVCAAPALIAFALPRAATAVGDP